MLARIGSLVQPLVLAAGGVLLSCHEEASVRAQDSAELARAETLFAEQCAVCHGAAGLGDGPASLLLFPPPRDFSFARFKVASTSNGIPSDEDLVGVLRRGLPGSSMPAWSWLPEEELAILARHVRRLATDGLAERLAEELDEELETGDVDWPQVAELAAVRLVPGKPLEIGRETTEPDAALLARGREVFERDCADCHGPEGQGRPEQLRRDRDETRNYARDLSSGVLKGGATRRDLSLRTQIGMHGTAMPAAGLSAANLEAVVAYLQSLLPPDADERGVQRRGSLLAVRVDRVPEEPDDPAWSQAQAERIVLAPLWWHAKAVREAELAALHDGETLVLRLEWADTTLDAERSNTTPWVDGAALQLTAEREPPFFGMGSGHGRTNLWHWKAVDATTADDLAAGLRLIPHWIGDWLADEVVMTWPHYQARFGVEQLTSQTAVAVPQGQKRIEDQPAAESTLRVRPRWSGDGWQVMFSRSLERASELEATLSPGTHLLLNCAIWNGAAHETGSRKSVSIWQDLHLEP